jgi:DUF1365 family protein
MSRGPPGLILSGRVMHARHVAPKLRFTYRIWMLALDLDRIGEVAAATRLFAHNRFAPVALHDRDHGPRDGTALRHWVAGRLAEAGLGEFGARIHFVAIPRLFGYGFNPIASYYCHDREGRLGAILHQVKNTFGDQHCYLLPVGREGELRHHATKRMHVSPFHDMQGGYRFACRAPDFSRTDGMLSLAIGYAGPEGPRMSAVMRLRAAPLTAGALARAVAAQPFNAVKVIAAIHWQAVKLWRGGARFHRAPAPPVEPVSLGGPA